MRALKHLLLILTLLLFLSDFGKAGLFSEEEKTPLNVFLRSLTEDSEAGYVVFNKKPVCIHGYYVKDPFHALLKYDKC